MNHAEEIVAIHGLQKSFGATRVLRGVNFTIKQGEIFCLLGSNGAGKTTLVNILSTLLAADGGRARVCGYDVKRQAERVRSVISLTGQYAAVDGFLTGRENLELIARLRHEADARGIARQMLERFNLPSVP